MCGGGGGAPEIKETDAERALAEVSAKKWNEYQNNFVPLEDQYMQQVDKLNSEANKSRVESNAGANVNSKFSGSNAGMVSGFAKRGIDPSSGGFKTKSNALQNAINKTVENARNNARFGAENSYIQGAGNVVAMGNGQDTAAMNSMAGLAGRASGEAINDARTDLYKFNADQNNTGAIVGAVSAYGMNGGIKDMNNTVNQAAINSGYKYDTGFNSNQSNMLADQERGFGILRG